MRCGLFSFLGAAFRAAGRPGSRAAGQPGSRAAGRRGGGAAGQQGSRAAGQPGSRAAGRRGGGAAGQPGSVRFYFAQKRPAKPSDPTSAVIHRTKPEPMLCGRFCAN
jgi:hypothetical protein